jgi:cell growth-regulating nucleolar protein
MVSFVCDTCQETLKKAKLEAHTHRCRNYQFSCIDCFVTFTGTTYAQHTSCISEAQKVQGKLFKPKSDSKNAKSAGGRLKKELGLPDKVSGVSLISQIEDKLANIDGNVDSASKKRKVDKNSDKLEEETPTKKSKRVKKLKETEPIKPETHDSNSLEIQSKNSKVSDDPESEKIRNEKFSKKLVKKLSKKISKSVKSIVEEVKIPFVFISFILRAKGVWHWVISNKKFLTM